MFFFGRVTSGCLILWALATMLESHSVYSQVYPYTNYSVRQGLVNSNVYAIAQDYTGYIWLGTENGLSRFDGIGFKNYTLEELNLTSFISSLTTTPTGKIIFGSGRNGVFQFDPVTENVTAINKSKISLSDQLLLQNDLLLSLHEYHRFEFLSVSEGIQLFKDSILTTDPDNKALSMIALKNNDILLGRTNGLYKLLDGRQLKLKINGMNNTPVYSLYEDGNSLLAGGDGVIFRIKNNQVTDTIKAISGEEKRVRNILVDNRGNIWFNIWGLKDIYMISEKNSTNVSEIAGINNGAVTRIVQDRSGTIWTGVLGKGVYHFSNNHLLTYPTSSDFPNANIRKIINTQKGGLLLGTDNGIGYLDPNGQKIISVIHLPEMTQFVRDIVAADNEYLVAITDIRLKSPLKNCYLFSSEKLKIRYAHGSSLWNDSTTTLVGNWDNKIMRYQRPEFDFIDKTESVFNETINNQRINCLFRDEYQKLWIGSQQGLCVINTKGEKFYPKSNLQQEEVLKISPLDNKTLMIISNSGFYFYENKDLENGIKELSRTPVQSLTCLAITSKNEYLAGTNYGLLFIKENKKWLMTIHDGILSDNINDIIHEKGSEIAWVATSEGLMRVDLSVLRQGNTIPIVIDHAIFRQDNKNLVSLPVNHFEYNKNSFRLDFQAFHYQNARKVRYQYKIDENDWLISPSNELQFASMEPGEHKILLRAGLPDEEWGPVKTIQIYIQPPFYRTWWFYILTALVSAVLILLFVKKQIHLFRLKQEEKIKTQQKIVELQQKALASNLNPHFVFNSLNAIQNFINTKNPVDANEYLAKFARLMRMHLNMAEKSSIVLHEEIQRLEYYLCLEQMRFDDKMHWSITVDPGLDPYNLEIPNMIIQPFVENAVWHGIMPSEKNGFISLAIEPGPQEELYITITDNGVGFQHQPKTTKNQHESKGTRLIRERLLLLDPSAINALQFEHLSPGTKVRITLTSKMYRKTAAEFPVSQK